MIIGGIQPCSFSDYPGKPAAVIFTQGCNFCCPFCHNVALLSRRKTATLSKRICLDFLNKRKSQLDAVVISGGEPCIHADLPDFIREIRLFGYPVKLDTNGTRPKMVKQLLDEQLLDYIAMDIKAPLAKYDQLSSVPVNTEDIGASIKIIGNCKISHHFRTTRVTQLLTPSDLSAIRESIPSGSQYILQPFVAENALMMNKTC